MNVFTFLGLVALCWAVVEVVKPFTPTKIPTVAIAWAVGVALVFIAASSSVFAGEEIFGHTFASLDAGAKVLAGFGLGSTAAAGTNLKQAIDGSDSASGSSKGSAYNS